MANALGFLRVYNGLTIKLSSNTPSGQGDIVSDSSTGNLLYHNGTTSAALASASNTITLTNKSIDASANTLTNIANAAIAAGAAIAYSKLNLAGSVVNADIATGAAIAYSKLNLGTSIVNADISASAAIAYSKLALTGSVVNADIGASAAIAHSKMAALTGSKIAATDASGFVTTTNGVVPVTAKGDLIVGSAASTASILTVGSDGTVPVADSGATTGIRWATQQQGNKNIITYNNFENGATTGWTLCNVGTLTNGLPSGTSPNFSFANGNLAISVVSASPLAGTKSLQALMTAASTVGDGVATQAYTIDAEDQAKVLGFRFAYKASANASNANFSGTSSNSFGVAVWDATNSVFIPVAGAFNLVQSSGVGIATGTFQTASNTASIRFVIYNVTPTAGAVTMLYDDFFCGPQVSSSGFAGTDWVAYTPTYVGLGTVTTAGAWSRRVGDSLEVYINGTSGTATGSTVQIGIGYNGGSGNVTVDTTKVSGNGLIGKMQVSLSATTIFDWAVLAPSSNATYVQVGKQSSTANALSPDVGTSAIGSTGNFQLFFRVPIVGWSSNTVQSADSDSRAVAFRANSSTASLTYNGGSPTSTIPASAGQLVFNSTQSDTHGAYNATTGIYTVPVTGYYNISGSVIVGGSASVNAYEFLEVYNITASSVLAQNNIVYGGSTTATPTVGVHVESVLLTSGTQICLRGFFSGSITSPAYQSASVNNYFSLAKVGGPAVVQATESINCSYTTSTTAVGTTATTIVHTNKLYDTHAAYNTTTGIYTIPVAGKYRITSGFLGGSASSSSTNSGVNYKIQKNGVDVLSIYPWVYQVSGLALNPTGQISGTVSCVAGETLSIAALRDATVGSFSLSSPAADNWVCIERIGN